MTVKAILVAVIVWSAVAGPWMAGQSLAVVIPEYFDDEWVGFACLTAVQPGSAASAVLLQLNFDKLSGGGLSVAQADTLFTRLTSSFGWLGQITGATYQVTCTLTPTQAQSTVAGLTARQAAQQLSGDFKQRGFAAYLILDSFLTVTPPYLGANIAIRRTDAFTVVGLNNLTYIGSSDVVEP